MAPAAVCTGCASTQPNGGCGTSVGPGPLGGHRTYRAGGERGSRGQVLEPFQERLTRWNFGVVTPPSFLRADSGGGNDPNLTLYYNCVTSGPVVGCRCSVAGSAGVPTSPRRAQLRACR